MTDEKNGHVFGGDQGDPDEAQDNVPTEDTPEIEGTEPSEPVDAPTGDAGGPDGPEVEALVEAIDGKYSIQATNLKTGEVLTEADGVFFKATDKALPFVLTFYEDQCRRLGADLDQIESVQRLKQRVDQFQVANLGKVKVADV